MSELPPVQVTARLLLRPWRPDDEDELDTAYDIYRRQEVSRWLGLRRTPPASRDEMRERVQSWVELGDGTLGVFAVVPFGGPDRPVGSVLLLGLPASDGGPVRAHEIGWHLHPDVWGRGYAVEAGRAMVVRARAAGLDEVHAVVHHGNERSMAVCDRLRMTRLGATREWYGVDLVDHVLPLRPAAADPLRP